MLKHLSGKNLVNNFSQLFRSLFPSAVFMLVGLVANAQLAKASVEFVGEVEEKASLIPTKIPELKANQKLTEAEESARGEARQKEIVEFIRKAPGSKVVEVLNSGWSSDYTKVRSKLKKGSSYVLLHAWDPGWVMDIRSANGFWSSISNYGLLNLKEFDIGHTWVGWRCSTPEGVIEGAAGQTGELDSQIMTMLKSGWGLASLKSTFTDGHIQPPELLSLAELYEGSEGLHTLFVEVDSSVCMNAVKFVEKYATHPSKPFKNFGLEPDPIKLQGGGCGSFGISVAQVAGVFGNLSVSSHFWRTLTANPKLFGYGRPLPKETTPFLIKGAGTGSKNVPMLDVLISPWSSFEAGVPSLRIMDPEMMLLFLRTIYRDKMNELRASVGPELKDFFNSNNLSGNPMFRAREIKGGHSWESKEMRDWRLSNGGREDSIVINKSYDPQAKKVVETTTQWLKTSRFKARFILDGDLRAVVLEKKP